MFGWRWSTRASPTDHPDLAPNVWTNPGESGGGKETNGLDDDGDGFVDDVHGWDFLQGDNQPLDFSGHGTHVAGTMGRLETTAPESPASIGRPA